MRTSWRRGLLAGILGSCVVLGLAACDSSAKRAASYYLSSQTSRAAAASAMAADWRAKKLLLDDCLNLAFEHIDKQGDAASVVFAGTVLDFAQIIDKELPQNSEMELFWTRLGGLAAAAAQNAYARKDITAARSVVLAGPARWQTEAYWYAHPNHDALASYILFYSGEGPEALRRLHSRAVQDPAVEDAIREIQELMRK